MKTHRVSRMNLLPCFSVVALVAIVCSSLPTLSDVTAAEIPFSLKMEEVTIEGLPGLHSAAWGCHEGKLILIGGRTGGMHGFSSRSTTGTPSFPPPQANDSVYIVDLASGRLVGSAKVDGLSNDISRQLKSTNSQFVTREKWLYIVGGYGVSADGKAMETINRVVAIDMPGLIAAVTNREPLNDAFAKKNIFGASHESLAVTGGALELLDDQYYMLVFGHRFDGLYFVGGGTVNQVYSQSVRAFQFQIVDGELKVSFVTQEPQAPFLQPVDGPYHRRDLPVEPTLVEKDGVLKVQIAAYGGVFKGGRFEGYVNPIYIDITPPQNHEPSPKISLKQDDSTVQLMSQYECAAISSYSLKSKTMYTTFFGGISQYYWDGDGLKRDKPNLSAQPPIDGLPFINTISTLKRGPEGNAQFLHVAGQFPPKPFRYGEYDMAYSGAQTIFVPKGGVPNNHDVLLLDDIAKPTVIGYLWGGIAASDPYPRQTCASPKFYQVTLTPGEATDVIKLKKPE